MSAVRVFSFSFFLNVVAITEVVKVEVVQVGGSEGAGIDSESALSSLGWLSFS